MSLRLMSLLGGGFNFFFNFHPSLGKMKPFWLFSIFFLNGLVQPPTSTGNFLAVDQPSVSSNQKTTTGRDFELGHSVAVEIEVWLDAFAGSLLQRPASCFFRRKKKTAAALAFFLFLLFVFFCVVWLGKQPDFLLFVCCCWCFFFFFSLLGKAKQKHQNVQHFSGNIYC